MQKRNFLHFFDKYFAVKYFNNIFAAKIDNNKNIVKWIQNGNRQK